MACDEDSIEIPQRVTKRQCQERVQSEASLCVDLVGRFFFNSPNQTKENMDRNVWETLLVVASVLFNERDAAVSPDFSPDNVGDSRHEERRRGWIPIDWVDPRRR